MVLREIAGFDPRDNVTGNVPVDDYLAVLEKGIKGLRIGISPDYLKITYLDDEGNYSAAAIDPEIEASVWKAVRIFKELGAEIIDDIPMSNTKYSVPAYFVITRIEAYSNLQRFDGLKYGHTTKESVKDMYDLYYKSRGEGFGYQSKLRLLTGLFASQDKFYEKYYRRAQRARALLRRDFDEAFDPNGKYRVDVILTPSTPSPAFKFGGATASDSLLIQFADQFTSPMNFAGTPGVSFPCGLSSEGLPIGLQVTGYDYCESKILQAAYAFEQATIDEDWRKVKPAVLR
ncbi:MAG: amidase [Flexilinea sp.]